MGKQTEKKRLSQQQTYDKLLDEVIRLLGAKCSVCSDSRREVLQIDHINGGGRVERAKTGIMTSYRVIRNALRAGESVPEWQVLCANCHAIKTYWASRKPRPI